MEFGSTVTYRARPAGVPRIHSNSGHPCCSTGPEQSNTGRAEAETIVRRLLRSLEIQNEDQIIASFFRAGGGGFEIFRQGSLVITTEAVSGDHTLTIGTKDDVMFMIGR